MRLIVSYLLLLPYFYLFVTSSDNTIVYPCTTPKLHAGVCTSLFSCPVLMKSLCSLELSEIALVKRSICSEKNFMVCCETKLAETNPINITSNRVVEESHISDFDSKTLLPTRKYCGLQQTDDRIYTGAETALDEFPWLAHVLFTDVDEEDDFEYGDRCNGVLINKRYVLINAFCARNPKTIRLGQHDTNKTVSCITNVDLGECSEPTLLVKIEEQIKRSSDEYAWYDFALFRLDRNISFSDFIRPICLPLPKEIKIQVPDSYVISGWGATNQSGILKKRITYDLTTAQECYKVGEDVEQSSTNSSYLCLKAAKNNRQSPCTGEEGGPLMYKNRNQWIVDGVITRVFTDIDCVSEEPPIDGIRITEEVMDWILNTIRP